MAREYREFPVVYKKSAVFLALPLRPSPPPFDILQQKSFFRRGRVRKSENEVSSILAVDPDLF
jgi:hypothetical protein